MNTPIKAALVLFILLSQTSCIIPTIVLANEINILSSPSDSEPDKADEELEYVYSMGLSAQLAAQGILLTWQDFQISSSYTEYSGTTYQTPTTYRIFRSYQNPWDGFSEIGVKYDSSSDKSINNLNYLDSTVPQGTWFYRIQFNYSKTDENGNVMKYLILSEAVRVVRL